MLLVEDNEINQQVALELLESAGVSVSLAEDGRQALEKLAAERFALVLMYWVEATGALLCVIPLPEDDLYLEIPEDNWRIRELSQSTH